jgi:hypothetical protein
MQPSRFRKTLAWVALGVILVLGIAQAGRLGDLGASGLHDYVAYWSAGRLNALGKDPYSPEELLPVQQEVGWTDDWPNIMYYPPWTLAVVMPFGSLPFGTSRLLWLVVNLGVVIGCVDRLWQFYGGPTRYRGVAWALGLVFVPTLIVLKMGQIGPWLLLGVVGFLEWEESRPWLAGAALVLASVKPQLMYLFGVAVLVWALDQRRWRVLLGGGLAVAGATGLALWRNPAVLQQYGFALAHPPWGNITPTWGSLLRLMFGPERTWLTFVPTAVGLAWLPFYYARHRRHWDWSDHGLVVLFVSFLSTSYGAWVFDLVVLLVPIVRAAVWVARQADPRLTAFALLGFLTINGGALAMNLGGAPYPSFIWLTPALFIGYRVLRWRAAGPALAPVGLDG